MNKLNQLQLLMIERDEVTGKLVRHRAFMKSQEYFDLPYDEQDLLIRYGQVLSQLEENLSHRIDSLSSRLTKDVAAS